MTLLPGSCGEFLQRLPSSKRLLFTESSGCRGFPAFTWGKGQIHKNIYQELSINKHLLTAAACRLGWVQQGKRRRKKQRSRPSKVRGHEGAMVSRGGRGGGVLAEGAACAKSGCGKACPGQTETRVLWSPQITMGGVLVSGQKANNKNLVCGVCCFPCCKYSHPGHFQATNMMSQNAGLSKNDTAALWSWCKPALGRPLLHSLLFPGTHGGCSQGLGAQGRARVSVRRAQG